MGLDMYLNAKKYIWREDELGKKIAELIPGLESERVKEITIEVGYWRKANQIHKWFVDNVQSGEDDCNTYEVSTKQLTELLRLVEEVLVDNSKAQSLLPTVSGFFFGDTKYERYYFDDLEYTRDTLKKCLTEKYQDWCFEYHSSW